MYFWLFLLFDKLFEELKKLSKADFDKHICLIDFDIFVNTNLEGDKIKVEVKCGPDQPQLVIKVVKVEHLVWNCNWHPLPLKRKEF